MLKDQKVIVVMPAYNAAQILRKTYQEVMARGDIIIMIHPDYQYTPRLIPAMASMIESGLYECVLGSRILGGYALKGGMPVWKYVANRFYMLPVWLDARITPRSLAAVLLIKAEKK